MNSYLIGKYEGEEVVTSFKILSNKEMGGKTFVNYTLELECVFFFVSLLN